MPRSILLGRPMPEPGEPLFTDEDTAYALALAEEERDTCAQCGLPIAVCSDPKYQFAFDAVERVCWPAHRLAVHREHVNWEKKQPAAKQSTFLSAKWLPGEAAPLDAGLEID